MRTSIQVTVGFELKLLKKKLFFEPLPLPYPKLFSEESKGMPFTPTELIVLHNSINNNKIRIPTLLCMSILQDSVRIAELTSAEGMQILIYKKNHSRLALYFIERRQNPVAQGGK